MLGLSVRYRVLGRGCEYCWACECRIFDGRRKRNGLLEECGDTVERKDHTSVGILDTWSDVNDAGMLGTQ